MDRDSNRDSEQYQPPTTWAEMFDHADPPIFTDEAGITTSAQQHAQRRALKDREAAEARDLRQLGAVAQDQADADALDKAVALLRAGKKVPQATRIAAMRAARDRGVPISSAELLASGRR
jgi:hypothetical protein